ncbi:unnamed protein product, partial [Didymodactylos carnosus]
WASTTLINSNAIRLQSLTVNNKCQLLIKEQELLAQFGRQILLTLSDGSLITFDKLTFRACEQTYPLQKINHLFTNRDKCEYFVKVQHTQSGCCIVGFTESGLLVLLRSMSIEQSSSP